MFGPDTRVDLLAPVRLIHTYLTQTLCEDVFRRVRGKERQRVWTLHRLIEFWTAVILRAPSSLTQALEEMLGAHGAIARSTQGFFSRCQGMRFEFFRDVFEAFVGRVVADRPPRFAAEHGRVMRRFTGIWLLDGSHLDAIAHRLKILWKEQAVILPGALIALYDLGHGVVRALGFDPDAAASEWNRAKAILARVPAGTLLVADRLYGTAQFFATLKSRGLFAVVRYAKSLSVRGVRLLERFTLDGGEVEDKIVDVGAGKDVEAQRLRSICWRRGRLRRQVLTNVLDPRRLSATEALRLYPARWSIERLFYDLKEVLNLHCFYAANPNAVAMQVYAAAIVHTALRVAQSEIAHQVALPPEELSVPKLFPRVAAASEGLAVAEYTFAETVRVNPSVRLRKPSMDAMRFAHTTLGAITVRTRTGPRRPHPIRRKRRQWKSLSRVRGMRT